jgi:hypothetical protein
MSEQYKFEFCCEGCGEELEITASAFYDNINILNLNDWTRVDTGEDYLYFCPECTEASNEQAYQGSL